MVFAGMLPWSYFSSLERYVHSLLSNEQTGQQLVEDDREDHHHQEWSNQRPGDTDHGPLVAHRNIAPRKHLEELTVTPQVLPVMTLGATGFDNEFLRHLLRLTMLTRSAVGTRFGH